MVLLSPRAQQNQLVAYNPRGYYLPSPATVAGGAVAAGGLYEVGKYAAKKVYDTFAPRPKKRKLETHGGEGTKTVARTGKKVRAGAPPGKRIGRRVVKKSLGERISALEKNKPLYAIHDYRNIEGTYMTMSENVCAYKQFALFDTTLIEGAIDALSFIDRGATPAVDSVDLSGQTYAHNIKLIDLYSKIMFRNNDECTMHLDVYILRVKDDNSSDPTSVIAAADGGVGLGDGQTNLLTFPSDFPAFNVIYTIVKHDKVYLASGDEYSVVWSEKERKYDPITQDALSSPNYRKGDTICLIRGYGGISHGITTKTLVGTATGQVDIHYKRKMKVKYESDAAFYKIETVNSLDTQTGGPEQAGPTVDSALASA